MWYLWRMDWKTQARKARALLKEVPHGGREAVLRTEGFTGGVNTVRRWAFALKYLERLKREEAGGTKFDDLAHVLLDQATLAEGGQLENPAEFVKRMNTLLVAQ